MARLFPKYWVKDPRTGSLSNTNKGGPDAVAAGQSAREHNRGVAVAPRPGTRGRRFKSCRAHQCDVPGRGSHLSWDIVPWLGLFGWSGFDASWLVVTVGVEVRARMSRWVSRSRMRMLRSAARRVILAPARRRPSPMWWSRELCRMVTVPDLSMVSVRTRLCGSMTSPCGVALGRAV